MKNKKTRIIPVLLCILIAALLFSSCDDMLREEEDFLIQQTVGYEDFTLLDIDSRNGFIEVESWAENSFRIEGKKYIQGTGNLGAELEKVTIKYKEIGSTIRIFVDFPENNNFFRGWSYGANFTVKVPEKVYNALNRIDIDTSNGSVSLSGFNGKVIADTSNGSMHFQDCTGQLNVKSSNGSISLSNINGQIDAKTSNSNIKLQDCDLSDFNNSFDTSNGSITGSFKPALSGTMRFDTSNGRIELRIPASSNLDFTAKTSNASVSIEKLRMTLTHDDRKNKSGRINNGGARLELSSSNGDVKLIGE